MWHLRDKWNMGIDPDATEVKSFGHAHRATMVGGPDT